MGIVQKAEPVLDVAEKCGTARNHYDKRRHSRSDAGEHKEETFIIYQNLSGNP